MLFRECFQHLVNIERKRIVTPDNVVMRLNRGEQPTELPFDLQRAIRVALGQQGNTIQQYPSYQQFYQKLAKHIAFPVKQIVVGAGIEEFIRTLMFLCCDPGQKAAVLWPTCAMYDIYAEAFGVNLIRIKPKPGEKLSVHELLMQVPADVRVLFIPNPGQPVETYFDPNELDEIAQACTRWHMVLAVDEAHYGFGAKTALPLVAKYPNVIVMRTFSKFYAAASARVGFVVAQPQVAKMLHAVRPSGEVTGPSMAVVEVLMSWHMTLQIRARQIVEARNWLRQAILLEGYRAWGHYGFSVLIELNSIEQMQFVVSSLATVGIYVKGNFPEPVERCILVACGRQALMQDFFDAFRQVIKGQRDNVKERVRVSGTPQPV